MIRWGIIGAGKIAHSFCKDLQLVKGGQLYAVASRNLDKAKNFANEYNAKMFFGSYSELFSCKEVDVVYIATPHMNHATLSIEAMKAGKHVLCEKPAGINRIQVEEMIKTAKECNVFFMEALWTRFNPTIRKVKQLIDAGDIGKISYLHADFAFYGLDKGEDSRVLNPYLAGGSLLDIGIYPVFLAYLLLGLPNEIQSKAHFYKTGVEIQTSMIFHYENAQAILYSGLTSNSEMKAQISGSNGAVFLHPRWHEASGYTLCKNDQTSVHELDKIGKGYSYEIMEVHENIEKGKLQSNFWSHQNSIDLISLLDTVRKQTGIVFPIE